MWLWLLLAGAMGDTPPPASKTVAPPATVEHVVVNPGWRIMPTAELIEAYYPIYAAMTGVEGHATLECRVSAEGSLYGCRVTEETPIGEHFGEAALAMASEFSFTPQTVDGAPIDGGKVLIPLAFKGEKVDEEDLEFVLHCTAVFQAQMQPNPIASDAGRAVSRKFLAARFAYTGAGVELGLRPSQISKDLETETSTILPLLSGDPARLQKELDACAKPPPSTTPKSGGAK
jgi:TonB family protein